MVTHRSFFQRGNARPPQAPGLPSVVQSQRQSIVVRSSRAPILGGRDDLRSNSRIVAPVSGVCRLSAQVVAQEARRASEHRQASDSQALTREWENECSRFFFRNSRTVPADHRPGGRIPEKTDFLKDKSGYIAPPPHCESFRKMDAARAKLASE